MTDPVLETFGRRILRARTARGWSLRDLAAKTDGLHASAIHRAERVTSEIGLTVAVKIATALEIPLGELLAEPQCGVCDDHPLTGFICGTCGRKAEDLP
jgi:ribosome-binding protein aMBF1 (putative translation factor)